MDLSEKTTQVDVIFSFGDFNEEEQESILKAWKEFGTPKKLFYVRDSVDLFPAVLAFVVTTPVRSFLSQMGKDWYDILKKKVSSILDKKTKVGEPTLSFKFKLDNIEVNLACRSSDPTVIGCAFNKLNGLLMNLVQLAESKKIPENLTRISAEFETEKREWKVKNKFLSPQ